MNSKSLTLIVSCSAMLIAFSAQAADKSDYTLFMPTPKNMMRDMSTDRPDQTESPYTVDAGHFQIEADIVNYTFDHDKQNGNDSYSKTWNVAPVNLKAGLTNSTDIQFVVENYIHQTDSDKNAGTRDRTDGFGDVTVRLKHNFWGNDGGKTAFALMPFVKFPTNSNDLGNDDIEGGLIAPLAIDLDNGYALTLMTELDVLKDGDDSGYHASFINSASFAVEWNDKLGSYHEIFTEKGTDTGDRWKVQIDNGVTYGLTDNVQLDAGVNIGVTRAADDFQPFVGVSYRY